MWPLSRSVYAKNCPGTPGAHVLHRELWTIAVILCHGRTRPRGQRPVRMTGSLRKNGEATEKQKRHGAKPRNTVASHADRAIRFISYVRVRRALHQKLIFIPISTLRGF